MALPQRFRLKDGRAAVVRRARPADAETWIDNVNVVAAERVYVMTEVFTKTVEEVRRQFAERTDVPTLWLVGEVERRVVAGADFRASVHRKNAHTASLGISVRPEYRGLGLGEAMMRAGIAWAREVGLKKLRLGVFSSNERAIILYRKLGFVEEGRLRSEVVLDGKPDDELLMALFL